MKKLFSLLVLGLSFISFGFCDNQLISSINTNVSFENDEISASVIDFTPSSFNLNNFVSFDDEGSYYFEISSNLDDICSFPSDFEEDYSISAQNCDVEIAFGNGDEGFIDSVWVDNYNSDSDFYLNLNDYPNGVYVWLNDFVFSKCYYDENDEEVCIESFDNVSIQIFGDVLNSPVNPDLSGTGDDSGGDDVGGDNPGGDNPGNDNFLLNSVGNVFVLLGNCISEFIPYIIYIGLGILVACIGFVAIKRLINWVKGKTLDPFK